jgi:hypothetical protein
MAKSTRTLHQPARTATPEELAEENRRIEEARAEELAEDALRERAPSGFILEPKSKLALEAEAYQESRSELVNAVTLIERSWAPIAPVELVAAFQVLAGWLERLDSQVDHLENQLALLHRRLDPDNDWQRPNPIDSKQGDPLDWLFDAFHREDGSRIEPDPGNSEGHEFVDIMRGLIRPVTWSQLLDALRVVALDHEYVSEKHEALASTVSDIHEWVSVLNRLATGPANPADVADAYVLGAISSLGCAEDAERADRLRAWWEIIQLWGKIDGAPVGAERSRMLNEVFKLEKGLDHDEDRLTLSRFQRIRTPS